MISRIYLRRLVESVLLEGYKDDQRYLIEKYPDHVADLKELSPKWTTWLITRYGDAPTREETHPFDDSIVTIVKFAKREDGLSTKYRSSAQFKADVDDHFSPRARGWRDWSDPNQALKLTVDQMETIMGLGEREKQNFSVNVSEDEMESDRVGKVGPWNLWMPTTRERSCKIAGYDPVTLKPKTVWCTARMAGSNLFYNYIGKPGADMTLFYVIRDDPKGKQDWLSVGFINGTPVLDGKHGSMSVDRDNDGLTPARLEQILGSDHDEIMRQLTEKNVSLGGKHPALEKIAAAAKSVEALKYLTTGLSKDETSEILPSVLRTPDVDPGVLEVLAQNPNPDIRTRVASKGEAPADVLTLLARDENDVVRKAAAGNKSVPAEALILLARDPNELVRRVVADNPLTPSDVIEMLAQDEKATVRSIAVRSRSISPKTLSRLAYDEDQYVRLAIASSPATPTEILADLAQDDLVWVRQVVASNPSTPVETIAELARNEEAMIRQAIASNPSTPIEILIQLADDKNEYIRRDVGGNPKLPNEVMARLARDKSTHVRSGVLFNENVPTEILQVLARDRSSSIRKEAIAVIAQRQQQDINERKLRQLIRRML